MRAPFFYRSGKLRNPGFQEMNDFKIAAPASVMQGQAQQKTLLAMTFRKFFSRLIKVVQKSRHN
jgi:hypothetical protein